MASITTNEYTKDSITVPYRYGNGATDSMIHCGALIEGDNSPINQFTGLNQLGHNTIPVHGDNPAIETFLTTIGYTSQEVTEEGVVYSCYEPSYKVPNQDGVHITEKIGPICWMTKDGKITGKGKRPVASDDAVMDWGGSDFASSKHGGAFYLGANKDYINFIFEPKKLANDKNNNPNNSCGKAKEGTTKIFYKRKVKFGESWNDVVADINDGLLKVLTKPGKIYYESLLGGVYCGIFNVYGDSYEEITMYNDDHTIYELPAEKVSTSKEFTYQGGDSKTILKYFTGSDEFPYYKKGDLYWMYYHFFSNKNYFNALSIDGKCEKNKPSGGYYLQYYDKTKKVHTYCPIGDSSIENAHEYSMQTTAEHEKGTIFGIEESFPANSGIKQYGIKAFTVEEVLNRLNAIDLKGYCNEDPDFPLCKATPIDCKEDPSLPGCEDIKPNPKPEEENPSDQAVLEEACYEHAKSLGWVICPVVFGLREIVQNTVYSIAERFLKTDDSIINQFNNENSGLYKAWAMFRDMANIAFVVLFMLVIFSQLTGFGIDNYGIKKVLPKIIIAAILINMSFFISGILVDLSNIFGKGLKELFENLGTNAVKEEFFAKDTNAVTAVGEIALKAVQFLSSITVTGAVVSGGLAIGTLLAGGWGILIPILLFLLTIVIAGLFALVILVVRQALIVALVTVSPLAFACIMLPNTTPIFKKWFTVMKNLLMVYPVIGAVIGVSYFTTCIIFSSGGNDQNFFVVIACGMLMVAPYFMVPSITRKALSAFGDIGSKIASAGSRLGSGLTRFANNTDAVQNLKADSKADMAAGRSKMWLNRHRGQIEKDLKEGKPISASRARAYMRALERSQGSNKANLGAYEAMLGEREANMKLNRMQHSGLEAKLRAQDMSEKETELSDNRLLSDESMSAWEANLENKAREAAISEQSSLLQKNNVFDDTDEFRKEVYNAATSGNVNRLEALMRKAASGSDKQRESLRKGMDSAFKNKRVNADVARAYGSHLTNNSVYKEKDRSMNDQGAAILKALNNGKYGDALANGTLQSLSNVGNSVIKGKRSVDSVFGYDDSEFDTLVEYAGAASGAEKSEVAKLMQDALDPQAKNDNGKYNNVKPETIKQIERVLGAAGVTNYVPNSTPQPVVSPTTGQPLYDNNGTIYLH